MALIGKPNVGKSSLINQIAGEERSIVSDIAGQTEQVCKNIKAILKKAETSMDNVVKTTCFLTDMKDFAAFNEVYAKHFPGKPARSCFAVKDLPAGALCEIEVIAVK